MLTIHKSILQGQGLVAATLRNMKHRWIAPIALLLTLCQGVCFASPDEDLLGKPDGYPLAPRLGQVWNEYYRVGSFSGMDKLSPHCVMEPSATPLPLPKANSEPSFRYKFENKTLSLDDYMAHQRVTALIVIKDGVIVAERSAYDRKPEDRMLSNSMSKTILALAIGKALESGQIKSLDDTAETYAPALAGTLYGQTKIVNLMRMASGARFVENYSGNDDIARFELAASKDGPAAAAKTVTERANPEGSTFNYASSETQMLGLVLRGATGQTVCQFVQEKLWQPMGAESRATWLTNPVDQTERFAGFVNATARDYARLGLLLANDGKREGKTVVPTDYLIRMTDAAQQPEQFRPGRLPNNALGYGLQTWLQPGSHRQFMLLGIYGQAILVYPELKLIMVHLAVAADASGDASGLHMGPERAALWRGIVARYGNW